MAEEHQGHNIYIGVNGVVVGKVESFTVKPMPEDQVLRAMGINITKEELAEYRRMFEEGLQGGDK